MNEDNEHKGGRKPVGTVIKLKGGRWQGFVTLPSGKRRRLKPFAPGTTEAYARERTAFIAEQIRLGKLSFADDDREAKRAQHAAVTCEQWAQAWYTDRKPRLASASRSFGNWTNYLKPILGTKHPRDWTRDDFRRVSSTLDDKVNAREISHKTALNVWGIATKMADDAANSKRLEIRCREDDPSENVRGPERGAKTARQYLYPSEVLKFVHCADDVVPLEWRRLVAVAVYTFARAGELRALTWDDVDLERGVITITKSIDGATGKLKTTKSKAPRIVPIEAALLPLLQLMRVERFGDEKPHEGARVVELPTDGHAARGLREWLTGAGIERRALFARGPSVVPIRFHDLRSTGITWSAIRGDDPLKIQARAGHTDFRTTQGYVREAEVLRAGFGEPFPMLPLDALRSNRSTQTFEASQPEHQKRKRPSVSAWPLVARGGFEPDEKAPNEPKTSRFGKRGTARNASIAGAKSSLSETANDSPNDSRRKSKSVSTSKTKPVRTKNQRRTR